MGSLSNQLLVVTILAYLLAMVGYAAEFAFGRQGAVARTAERDAALVGAGAPVPPVNPVETGSAPEAGRTGRIGRLAVALTAVGWLAHVATLVTRGLAAHRVPWGNMYEFVLAVCLVGASAWLVLVTRRPNVRPLGLFVTLALVSLLGLAGMRLYTAAGPLVPALNSYWLKVHVTAACLASGIFLMGFVTAAMTLIRTGYDAGKRRFPYPLGDRLPEAASLERLTFRVHTFAFPIWTFAIICGAIWAREAWTQYWSWDPKETWSFISWVVYAGYLHARATPSVKRTVATWIAVVGWGTMMINLFAINLVVSGLHSYAGVK
jgi:cytochrome c-type biogenesis protein CcsB